MQAVALLSGGLDSVVAMLLARQESEIIMALTVDYGQKARHNEIQASAAFCSIYGINHKVVDIPFMQDMRSGLIEASGLEDNAPWVPNRNGLLINIAACYAEDLRAARVVCGFNQEEGLDFPDNTREFIAAINASLSYSTLNQVQVFSPVQDMDKVQIVNAAGSMGIDLKMIWSCYRSGDIPCGQCPSCLRNLKAYKKAGIKID